MCVFLTNFLMLTVTFQNAIESRKGWNHINFLLSQVKSILFTQLIHNSLDLLGKSMVNCAKSNYYYG